MVRSTVKKVLWVGRATVFVVGLAMILAVVLGVVTTAAAHTGSAGLLHLGHANTATATSKLTANIANPALHLVNTSTSAGATALRLQTATSKPPLTVNSSSKVANLNADQVDGQDSTDFLPGGNLPSGSTIRGSYAILWTADAADEFQSESMPFGFTLASAPTVHFVARGSSAPTECPGSVSTPEAAPGNLCIYEHPTGGNISEVRICDPVRDGCPAASRQGAVMVVISGGSGDAMTMGTWAVTAP
jgi:hypothetical protein